MYPRNAASPERIAIGAVVQISDGAVQGSAVDITVRGQGGAEGAGAGTTAYGATGVVVYYTPTQGETDFTSFVVIASKTGCIPVAVTIITSASATPGNAGLDWGKVINPTTTVGLTNTTVGVVTLVNTLTTYTGNTVQTGDSFARIGATGSGLTTLATQASVNTIDDFLDTELAALITTVGVAGAGLTAIDLPNQTMDITGNITGNLSGSVGSVTGAVGSVTGAVGSVTGAVGSVTSAITLPTIPTAWITADGIAANAIGASELAADAATEIATAVLTTAMTESYAANGAAPTLAQAQFAIHQMLMDFGISGTSLTVLKLDNATTAFVVTLSDATNPVAAART